MLNGVNRVLDLTESLPIQLFFTVWEGRNFFHFWVLPNCNQKMVYSLDGEKSHLMARIYFLGADNKAVLIVRWNGLVVLRLLLCKAHLPPVATAKKTQLL